MNVINFAPYIDWRLWAMFIFISLFAFLMSHYMKRGNEVYMIIAVLFGTMAFIGSFSVADFTGPSSMGIDWVNTSYNTSVVTHGNTITDSMNGSTSDYVYTRNIYDLSNIWMSVGMGIYWIITILNCIFVYVDIVIPRAKAQEARDAKAKYFAEYGGENELDISTREVRGYGER